MFIVGPETLTRVEIIFCYILNSNSNSNSNTVSDTLGTVKIMSNLKINVKIRIGICIFNRRNGTEETVENIKANTSN